MLMAWSPTLSVGVNSIDDQHKTLVGLANDLHDSMRAGQAQDQIGVILNGLVAYTLKHFAHEEAMMARYNYPQAASHKAEHVDLVNQVSDMMERHKMGEAVYTVELAQFLRDWLTGHIQGTDKKLGTWLNQQGLAA